jgi:hypothetical protein
LHEFRVRFADEAACRRYLAATVGVFFRDTRDILEVALPILF